MKKIIKFVPNAYSLSEVAKEWDCTERQIIQLALDGKLRLAIKVYNETLVDIYTHEDGETIEHELSFFDQGFYPSGRYIFIGIPELIAIEKDGQIEARVFEEIDGDICSFKEPITVKTDYLRLLTNEKKRFEDEQAKTAAESDKPLSQKERKTFQNIITALMECIEGRNPDIVKHPSFKNRTDLFEYIGKTYKGYPGLSKSNLDRKIPEAECEFNKP